MQRTLDSTSVSRFRNRMGGSLRILTGMLAIVTSMSWTRALAESPARWQELAKQVVVVRSEGWDSMKGVLMTLERDDSGWRAVMKNVDVTLGRKGLGVGLGLHPPDLSGPEKREGDKRAPAGVFPLEFSFGTLPQKRQGRSLFAYLQTGSKHFWVDDSRSSYYNQWVDLGDSRIQKDWSSAEVLHRSDGIYDLVIVVGHNRDKPVPGRGSAIFLHRWFRPGVATIGCTAMSREDLQKLWSWLDPGKAPVLIQAPRKILGEINLPGDLVKALLHP